MVTASRHWRVGYAGEIYRSKRRHDLVTNLLTQLSNAMSPIFFIVIDRGIYAAGVFHTVRKLQQMMSRPVKHGGNSTRA